MRLRARDPRRIAAVVRSDLVCFLADQRLELAPSLTLQEVGERIEGRYRVSATPFVEATSAARFGALGEAEPAAARARSEHRKLIRALRRDLSRFARVRGLFSVRSLLLRPAARLSRRSRPRRRPAPQRA